MTSFHRSSRPLFPLPALSAVLVLAGLALATGADAQRAPRTGAGFFAAGASFMDIDALNSRLETAGYPTFQSTAISLGGGGYRVTSGGILVGGEGYGVLGGEEAHEGRSVTLGAGYGLFNVGYMFAPSPRARFYPIAGIGGGGTSLNIGAQPTTESFDDILDNPNRHANLGRAGMILSLGAGAEYRGAPTGRGVMIGVRAGYIFAPTSAAWRLHGNAVGDGPDASLAGPYVRIMIGGAGR